MRRPCTRKDAPAKQRGIWRKTFNKLKNSDKTTFYTPIEAKVMSAPSSTRPEEREFVVDPGASMHMMSKKKESRSGEMDTVKRSRTPTVVLTANGEVQTHEEAQVFVHDLSEALLQSLFGFRPTTTRQWQSACELLNLPMPRPSRLVWSMPWWR